MARVAIQVGKLEARRGRHGSATGLFRTAWDGLVVLYRRSREREELAGAASLAGLGRETGAKC
jgi:hypothetical protein